MAPTTHQPGPQPQPIAQAVVRLERHYTQAILSGAMAPGTKLPPSNEIAREWSVSATVVQRAMRRLSATGLVDRERKSGTVVRSRAERALVGLIVGPSLADEIAHAYRALVVVLESSLNRHGLSCRVYDGVHPMSLRAPCDYRSLDLLEIDRVYYQFKGFILLSTVLTEPAEITASGLPKSAFEWQRERTDIWYDRDAMASDILREIALRKQRRILTISVSRERSGLTIMQKAFSNPGNNPGGTAVEHLTIKVAEQGPQIEKIVFERMSATIAEWKKEPATLPEAIVVLDDIVARAVCMALLKFQIAVPRDLDVVVLAAESIEHHYGMPVHRYEISYLDMAAHLTSLLWKRITGEPLPPVPVSIRGKFKAAY